MGRLKNLPADLSEFSSELLEQDRVLGNEELAVLSLFANLEKRIGTDSNPGAAVLRYCPPGRVLCQQADAGATAFYILTEEDVDLLRRMDRVLDEIDANQQNGSEPVGEGRSAELESVKLGLIEEAAEMARTLKNDALEETDSEMQSEIVAEARLLTPRQIARREKGFWSQLLAPFRKPTKQRERPSFIPVDAPTDIRGGKTAAPLRVGDVFGEMSCLRRVPRSATVVATKECYVLEMLLVIFNKAQSDPVFKQRMDALYRKRTLSSHLREFSFFGKLSDEEFNRIKDHLELQTFQEGEVLFDEFEEASDCAFVIRSGLVQVRKHMHLLFSRTELNVPQWKQVGAEAVAAIASGSGLGELLAAGFPEGFLADLQSAGGEESLDADQIRPAFNQFVREADLRETIESRFKVKTVGDLFEQLGITIDSRQIPRGDIKIGDFSGVFWRVVKRLILEAGCPSLPRRATSLVHTRTLTYLGRGSHVGEMGVLRGDPRNATCIAFEDESSVGRSGAGNTVEVVRLDGELLRTIARENRAVADSINQVIQKYEVQQGAGSKPEESSRDYISRELDDYRVVEGRNLMLVDLDRCTRCGECINACVDSHDDGLTRLYLEGTRIGKYLIPMTCRECVDPYCMRNCPVSAIYRGPDGEMTITDWCIGCQRCAEDCPFGSIHMNPIDSSRSATQEIDGEFKTVTQQATVCDLCSQTPSKDPSCVYACPHDAAIRVNGREFYDVFQS